MAIINRSRSHLMVQDETSFAYRMREQVITPEYTEPVDLPPYTMEELNARILFLLVLLQVQEYSHSKYMHW